MVGGFGPGTFWGAFVRRFNCNCGVELSTPATLTFLGYVTYF